VAPKESVFATRDENRSIWRANGRWPRVLVLRDLLQSGVWLKAPAAGRTPTTVGPSYVYFESPEKMCVHGSEKALVHSFSFSHGRRWSSVDIDVLVVGPAISQAGRLWGKRQRMPAADHAYLAVRMMGATRPHHY
jgi:hypothetical protein